jgi:hypothetical protein
LTTNLSPCARSFWRSRQACESSVRVEPIDRKSQTSRSSSSFVKTRVGADASARSSANSFAASVSCRPRTVATRAAGSTSSAPTRSRPRCSRARERLRIAAIRQRSSVYANGLTT